MFANYNIADSKLIKNYLFLSKLSDDHNSAIVYRNYLKIYNNI